MKIQIVSDLHMEFAPIEIVNGKGADVLILSGDILVADVFTRGPDSPYAVKAAEWLAWMERTCAQFERVYYVLGNHEHYRGRFYETYLILQEKFGNIPNLVILDNTIDYFRNFMFVGGTLWTDFDRDNLKAYVVQQGLNDYKLIEGKNYRKLLPTETSVYHDKMKRVIKDSCDYSYDTIVVGHHAPSYRSITEQFRYGRYASLNPGYCSNLDDFIYGLDGKVKLWTHGHVHSSHDYMIGETRIVANPRGYNDENKDFDPNLTVEV